MCLAAVIQQKATRIPPGPPGHPGPKALLPRLDMHCGHAATTVQPGQDPGAPRPNTTKP